MNRLPYPSRLFTGLLLALLPIAGFTQSQEKLITIDPDLQLTQLSESFYIHTSWYSYPDFGRVPCNGLIFVKNGSAILIDTPNDDKQTKQLANYLRDSLQIRISKVIVGHSHNDCLGGLNYLHNQGIESISGNLTQQKCKEEKLPIPHISFQKKLNMNFYGEEVICRYFGGGHTIDNIVVFFPKKEVLFGGCLIKSINSKNLGFTGEADINNWDNTVKKVQEAYPNIRLVIPGHGSYGDAQLLTHTIELVRKNRN